MPARLTSYRHPISSRPGASRSQRHRSWASGLVTGLLAISSTAIGNDCAEELRTLPLPADAAEVYRDDRVVLGGEAMCQIAYTTGESVDMLVSLYERHWTEKSGDLLRLGGDDDDDGAILVHSGGQWERYMAIGQDGSGHAVMMNIMAGADTDPLPVDPYLSLPDGFELDFQQRNSEGFSLSAETSLALTPATRRIMQPLERAGWDVDSHHSFPDGEYRSIAMSRGAHTLDLAVREDHDGTRVTIHALVPEPIDE